MATLIAMFHPGGEWDAKPYLARELGVGSGEGQAYYVPTGSGLEKRADVYGNYQYGYMMSRFGYSVEQVTDASHVSSVAGNPDPADDLAIRLGYGLAERYPSGPTGIEFFRRLVAGEHVGEMLKVKAGKTGRPVILQRRNSPKRLLALIAIACLIVGCSGANSALPRTWHSTDVPGIELTLEEDGTGTALNFPGTVLANALRTSSRLFRVQ